MASSLSVRMLGRALRSNVARRAQLHTSAARHEITKFTMPAMSPTMTEGGLATWKVKEGEKFSAGDVLLEIETDKATMDVEAQEDGVMAKIVVDAGAKGVPVGKTIAMLAEEGDDISSVEVPAEEEEAPAKKEQSEDKSASTTASSSSSSSSSEPSSSKSGKEEPSQKSASHAPDIGRTLFPSVSRILAENHVSVDDAKKIKGTGLHGMITKGDALAFLGQASSPTGTYKVPTGGIASLGSRVGGSDYGGGAPQKGGGGAAKPTPSEPLTGEAVRGMIFAGLAASSHATRSKAQASSVPSPVAGPAATGAATNPPSSAFDQLLDDYEFVPRRSAAAASASGKKGDSLSGLL